MQNMATWSPNRSFIPPTNSAALEKSLVIKRNRHVVRKCIIWGLVNAVILLLLLYDVTHTCPLYLVYYDYVEYALIGIVTLNLIYYVVKIALYTLKHEEIPITAEQRKLLGISDKDSTFKTVPKATLSPANQTMLGNLSGSSNSPGACTPMNTSALSWRSNFSPGESFNYSLSSPSWTYHKINPNNNTTPARPPREQSQYESYLRSRNQSPLMQTGISSPCAATNQDLLQYRDTSGTGFISDELELDRYLQDFEANTSAQNLSNQQQQQSNLLSSFWSHPVTKTAKDMTSFLKRTAYQLSPLSSPNLSTSTSSPNTTGTGGHLNKTSSSSSGIVNKSSPATSQTSALVAWARMNVDIVQLTRWNENLRKWLSQTILERLVDEFDRINESLEKQGFADIKIGGVGLDRLRKTAQMAHITHFIPSLSTLIPFLEVTSNQEYLVKRIRELAKGGCMSEFKWNGGSNYNGKEWDESLPTDSAIIMHLLASYLDTQLMPLPSMPDTKPFSGLHYIKCKDKMPPLAPNSLLIQCVSEKPPHYRVIVGETIYEMVKGYSNLFHSILFFLYNVNKVEHGMLGRVNLGRAGVNMLWIIDQFE